MPASRKRPPTIGAIMKREAPYIVEWVAWHRLQGFDLIVADNCTEGTQTAVLCALEAAGELVRLDVRDIPERPQLPSYERILARAREERRPILGFLDADEFFEPLGGDPWGGAALVEAELSRPFLDAVSFRWCTFGSAGRQEPGTGPVVARFPLRGTSQSRSNQYVKSFGRVAALRRPLFGPHVLPVPKWRYALDGRRFRRMRRRDRPEQWHLARIRHYALKSRAEYEVKRGKGDVFYRPGEKPREDSYWEDYDLNAISDPLAPEVLAVLKSRIEAIQSVLGRDAIA